MKEKNKKILIILSVVFILLTLLLSGYVIYKKVLNNKKDNNEIISDYNKVLNIIENNKIEDLSYYSDIYGKILTTDDSNTSLLLDKYNEDLLVYSNNGYTAKIYLYNTNGDKIFEIEKNNFLLTNEDDIIVKYSLNNKYLWYTFTQAENSDYSIAGSAIVDTNKVLEYCNDKNNTLYEYFYIEKEENKYILKEIEKKCINNIEENLETQTKEEKILSQVDDIKVIEKYDNTNNVEKGYVYFKDKLLNESNGKIGNVTISKLNDSNVYMITYTEEMSQSSTQVPLFVTNEGTLIEIPCKKTKDIIRIYDEEIETNIQKVTLVENKIEIYKTCGACVSLDNATPKGYKYIYKVENNQLIEINKEEINN